MNDHKSADKLIRHLKTCKSCKRSRRSPGPRFCPAAKHLIRATARERHP